MYKKNINFTFFIVAPHGADVFFAFLPEYNIENYIDFKTDDLKHSTTMANVFMGFAKDGKVPVLIPNERQLAALSNDNPLYEPWDNMPYMFIGSNLAVERGRCMF